MYRGRVDCLIIQHIDENITRTEEESQRLQEEIAILKAKEDRLLDEMIRLTPPGRKLEYNGRTYGVTSPGAE